MSRYPGKLVLSLALLLGGASVSPAAQRPVAVSPGSPTGSVVASRCPAFSWGAVAGAASYELVVYRTRESGEEPRLILRETLPGAASLWTPAADACLERGGRYAWSVRAQGGESVSEWSPPKMFEVAPGPSPMELAQVLHAVDRARGEGGAPGGVADSGAPAPLDSTRAPSVKAAPGWLAAVAGDGALRVNGAAVLTTATFGAGLCEALTYRYVDQGDGTVRDCNTGKIWLKDASCLGAWPWSDPDPSNPNIFDKVAELNGGADFGCEGYTPGTYTDWQVPAVQDFCDTTLGNGQCPPQSAPTSLIDSTVSGSPKVANARGVAGWSEGDAFVGLQFAFTDEYWTASCFESCLLDAYRVSLFSGVFVAGGQAPAFWIWPVRSGP